MLQKLRAWLNGLSDRVINEQDSEQDKLNKTLLIFACGLMGFGSILWLALYWAMGIKFSSTVPLTYLAVSALSLGYYVYTLNYAVFRTTQVSLFLFMPFIMQWSIGSYVSSSGVALWALLAPVALYPDQLLSQILRAATYPLEVVEAARNLQRAPGILGDEALDAQRHVRQAPGGVDAGPQ